MKSVSIITDEGVRHDAVRDHVPARARSFVPNQEFAAPDQRKRGRGEGRGLAM